MVATGLQSGEGGAGIGVARHAFDSWLYCLLAVGLQVGHFPLQIAIPVSVK